MTFISVTILFIRYWNSVDFLILILVHCLIYWLLIIIIIIDVDVTVLSVTYVYVQGSTKNQIILIANLNVISLGFFCTTL